MTDVKRSMLLRSSPRASQPGPEPAEGRSPSLHQAKDAMLTAWFPVNHNLLREIQKGLAEGRFDHDRAALIQELTSDFSLFGVFLKAMPRMAEAGQVLDPARLLREVDIQKLKEALQVSETQVSPHSFSNMVKAQAFRVKHSLISCSTAEILAEKMESADPIQAYVAALLRQLGHNLLAWNYPRIYSRALSQATVGDEELDVILTKVLGFSPNSLVQEIASDWRITPELKLAIGMRVEPGEMEVVGGSRAALLEKVEQLSKACQIGETMAQVSDPEYYPTAAFKWSALVDEVSEYLGESGMQVISRQIEKLGSQYHSFAPTLFEPNFSFEKKLRSANAAHAGNLMARNPYAAKCPPQLQDGLFRVYRYVIKGQLSTEAVGILLNDVIPRAGYPRGCLYLVDSVRMVLNPVLKIGPDPLSRYKSLNCSYTVESDHPLVEALYCTYPMKQEGVLLHGERVSHISGAIGNEEKPGVLYLELGEKLLEEGGHAAVLQFKAIARCLNECLNLA